MPEMREQRGIRVASANQRRGRILNPVPALHKMQLHVQGIQLNCQISREEFSNWHSIFGISAAQKLTSCMVNALSRIESKIDFSNPSSFSEYVARGKWRARLSLKWLKMVFISLFALRTISDFHSESKLPEMTRALGTELKPLFAF